MVITMCQGKFNLGKKCIALVRDVDNRGGYACVGVEGVWEFPVTPFQFCCKAKTSLKLKT